MVFTLKYAQGVLDGARKAGVHLLSARFAEVTAELHLSWVVNHKPQTIDLDGYQVVMNDGGWPAGVAGLGDKNVCQQLWEGLLQNPTVLPDALPSNASGAIYWSPEPVDNTCRYNLVTPDSEQYWFTYRLNNGRVQFGNEG